MLMAQKRRTVHPVSIDNVTGMLPSSPSVGKRLHEESAQVCQKRAGIPRLTNSSSCYTSTSSATSGRSIKQPKERRINRFIILCTVLIFLQSHEQAGAFTIWYQRVHSRSRIPSFRLSIPATDFALNETTVQSSRRMDFDYSSTGGWELFYQEERERDIQATGNGDSTDNVVEWHSSVSLEFLADLILSTAQHITDGTDSRPVHVLLVGCGTSRLPSVLLKRQEQRGDVVIRQTLLDSSPTCIHQLKERYQQFTSMHKSIDTRMKECNGSKHESDFDTIALDFVCGDATRLSDFFPDSSVDIIFDKGLVDAFLCGEGSWERSLTRLFKGVSKVLRTGSKRSGSYILVSYCLASATKAFLEEESNRVGITFDFNCDGSDERVEISIGRSIR